MAGLPVRCRASLTHGGLSAYRDEPLTARGQEHGDTAIYELQRGGAGHVLGRDGATCSAAGP